MRKVSLMTVVTGFWIGVLMMCGGLSLFAQNQEMTFGGMGGGAGNVRPEDVTADLARIRAEQAQMQETQRKDIEEMVERHVRNQRTSLDIAREGKAEDKDLLYVRMMEFDDFDGDGVTDHPTDTGGSVLEKKFDIGGKTKLDVYKYFEAYRGYEIDGEVRRRLRRVMQDEAQKKADEVGEAYADQLLDNIRDEGGSIQVDLAEDALRHLDERRQHYTQHTMQYERIKRIENMLEKRSQREHEARIKSGREYVQIAGGDAEVAPGTRLDAGKKSDAVFEARAAFVDEAGRRDVARYTENVKQYGELLKEYEKKHPECLKPEFNCYVNEKGEIVIEHRTDAYHVAEQVMEATEYAAQAQLLYDQKGTAFQKRLPGEMEIMTPAERRKLDAARAREQRRLDVARKIIERKVTYQLDEKTGRMVATEEDTGKRATDAEVRDFAGPSAYIDGRAGAIDQEEMKRIKDEEGGPTGLFKTLDY